MNPYGHTPLDGSLGLIRIPVKFSVTTAGAVNVVSRGLEYFASIVKGTTGFVVTLLEPCVDFVSHNMKILPTSYSSARACNIQIAAVDVGNQTTPTITFLVVDGLGGTAIDMTTGDVVYGEIVLKFVDDNG